MQWRARLEPAPAPPQGFAPERVTRWDGTTARPVRCSPRRRREDARAGRAPSRRARAAAEGRWPSSRATRDRRRRASHAPRSVTAADLLFYVRRLADWRRRRRRVRGGVFPPRVDRARVLDDVRASRDRALTAATPTTSRCPGRASRARWIVGEAPEFRSTAWRGEASARAMGGAVVRSVAGGISVSDALRGFDTAVAERPRPDRGCLPRNASEGESRR